jgi:hypothetical protein
VCECATPHSASLPGPQVQSQVRKSAVTASKNDDISQGGAAAQLGDFENSHFLFLGSSFLISQLRASHTFQIPGEDFPLPDKVWRGVSSRLSE